ncbi:glutaminase A [Aureobasidium pullulans]|uniref:Glutaminase A n=1 Tax=Aureobasidium pullulans TaxID=5580 RepID=A0A4S8YXW9_AURPU|nr:glutaminase A [Aureobasidium pullulans]THY18873.1 glutaminase A [Aureobasidium pullulans]
MLSLASLTLLASTVLAQSSFSPTRPPAIPLAVSNPYLNTWQQAGSDGGNGGHLAGQWPRFWAGQVTGWTGLIKVDGGAAVTWMGAPNGPAVATQNSFEYTSTKSVFSLSVDGKVGLNVTFLSPVEPTDFKRQSIPASYMNVEAFSLDGADHKVQLYSDVSAEWASGDRSAVAEWDFGSIKSASSKRAESASGYSTLQTVTVPASSAASSDASPTVEISSEIEATTAASVSASATATGVAQANSITYHRFYRQEQQIFVENSDQASWGNWIYACSHEGLTYSNGGVDTDVRGAFINNGVLDNDLNTNYRAISNQWPVFAFALDFGSVGSTPQSALFTLTLAQNEAIQFEYDTNKVQQLPPLWTSYFTSELDLVSFFYNDWSNAQTSAASIDTKVATDSLANAGQDYLTITSLAVRQVFATTQLAGTTKSYHLFMKEISSNGDMQTDDVIFPAFPIFLYFNPDLGRLLLEPLFINQEAGNWPAAYAIHDLGVFPNATGHNDGNAENQPLEECGNMIIMALAVAQKVSGGTAYLNQHYEILKQWNDYLVIDSLIPSNQISTDDFAGSLANQTNLALKGIIGIEAMAVIANLTGHSADAENFTSIAHDYITKWQGLGIAPATNGSLAHTTLAYGMPETHGLLYNLYADTWVGTNIVPRSVYEMQSSFYPTVAMQYGVPLDTRHTYTKLDWEIFVASIASPSTKSLFISKIADWIGKTTTNRPFTDLYETESGDYPGGINFAARPVMGAVFAPLLVGQGPLG